MHAAVIAINDAVDHQVVDNTLEALRNPSAHLVEVTPDNSELYQPALYQAKSTKATQALAKVWPAVPTVFSLVKPSDTSVFLLIMVSQVNRQNYMPKKFMCNIVWFEPKSCVIKLFTQ